MAKIAKQDSIKEVLKSIEKSIKILGGKNPQIGFSIIRGKNIHHEFPMGRTEPNKTVTVIITVNGGAENVEFALKGMY